jgi:polygalacturonase
MKNATNRLSRRGFLSRLSNTTALALAAPVGSSLAAETSASTGAFEVKEFGARGDGQTLDTGALQKAIDSCARSGGGTVHFPPGRYLSGTLLLRSAVTLDLEAGATLLGSPKLEHYPSIPGPVRSYTDNYTERSLIYGEHLSQVSLRGRGVIDGRGAAFKGSYKNRPYLMRLIDCQDVSVTHLTLRDSPMWVQHYLACEGVNIDGITVISRCNSNNDGIDIDGCQRVRIANCDIRSGDDAIVLKSTLDRPCKNVAITNCLLSSDCNAFKLGTESNGGFENIVLTNCAIYETRLAGIALETVDGAKLEGVTISSVSMSQARCPIFIRLGDRARPYQQGQPRPPVGSLRNVSISGVQATGADPVGCSITGLAEHPVENITLRDIRLEFTGGGKEADARKSVPEKPEAYPEYSMFGTLPAYGIYCRHARNLALEHVEVSCVTPEARPALVCDDVEQLEVSAWGAASGAGQASCLRFENVREALVYGCRAPRDAGVYLRVEGSRSSRIHLIGNDLSYASNPVETAPGTPLGAVSLNPTGP